MGDSISLFEQMGGTYTQVGDYLLPNIVLSDPQDAKPLRHYGMKHKKFIKDNYKVDYGVMLSNETLYPHCRKVEELAIERTEQLMASPVSNAVENKVLPNKSLDPIGWVGVMNNIKSQVDEIVDHELIYTFDR